MHQRQFFVYDVVSHEPGEKATQGMVRLAEGMAIKRLQVNGLLGFA